MFTGVKPFSASPVLWMILICDYCGYYYLVMSLKDDE